VRERTEAYDFEFGGGGLVVAIVGYVGSCRRRRRRGGGGGGGDATTFIRHANGGSVILDGTLVVAIDVEGVSKGEGGGGGRHCCRLSILGVV